MVADFRLDGLQNLLTGQGTRRDPALHTRVTYAEHIVSEQELSAYYRTNWACRKIVAVPPDFMTRTWGQYVLGGEASSDETQEVNQYLAKLKLAHKFRTAQRIANLYGNAALILLVDDGQDDYSKPINWKAVKSLVGVSKPISCRKIHPEISIDAWDLEEDDKPTMFEVVSVYRRGLTDANGNQLSSLGRRIHGDRVLWFRGKELDEDTRNDGPNNLYWGCDDSILQDVIPVINRYGMGFESSAAAVARMNHKMFGAKKLGDILQNGGKEAEDYFTRRISSNEIGESIWNTTIYDLDNEKYEYLNPTVAGVEGVLKMLRDELIAASDLAPSVLYQIFASGIDAAGKTHSEKQTINADMRSLQEKKFDKPLEDLFKVVHAAKDGPTKGKEPEQWDWVWHDLQPTSDTEKADLRLKYMSLIVQMMQVNDVVANKMVESHWGGAEFNPEVTIDFEELKREAEERAAQEQEQQLAAAEGSEEFAPDEGFDPFAEGEAEEMPPEEPEQFDSVLSDGSRFRQMFRLDADDVLKLDGKRDRKQIAYGLLVTPEQKWTTRQRQDAKRVMAYLKVRGCDGGEWVRG